MHTPANKYLFRQLAITGRRRAEVTSEYPRKVVLILKSQPVTDFLDRNPRLTQGMGGIFHLVMHESARRRPPGHLPAPFGERAHTYAQFGRDRRGRKILRQ